MGFLLIISITIVGIIYGVDKLQQDSNVTRPKRSLERDTCREKYGGIELNYIEDSATSFTFDICSVLIVRERIVHGEDMSIPMCSSCSSG